MKELGERLRRARSEAHLSQAELAARIGMTSAAISRWEKGLNEPRKRAIGALARVLPGFENESSDISSKPSAVPPAQDERLDAKEETFLSHVPATGVPIGNGRLRGNLGWELAEYLRVKKSLINKGSIQTGRGRGGSVSRVQLVVPRREAQRGKSSTRVKEKDLYPIFKRALEAWVQDQGWTDFFIEHKPSQGKKNTGGMWTRPDFVVVGHKKYEYTPGTVRDIETFEVKTTEFSVDAVFETASHSRFATKSYLAIERGADSDADDALLARTEAECQRFGIGLVLFGRDTDPTSWDWRVEAIRKEPDPQDVETFIAKQFDEEHKKQLRNWF
jgi:transcriptional regulator with XRE-family HTH domain